MTKNENDKNRVRVRKQNSGAYNRKLKKRREALIQSQAGAICKFIPKIKELSPCSHGEEGMVEDRNEEIIDDGVDVANEEDMGVDRDEDIIDDGVDIANEDSRQEHNEDPIRTNDDLGNEEVNEKHRIVKNQSDKNRVRIRKQNSGAYNRKLKKRREALIQSQAGAICKFFPKIREPSPPSQDVEEMSEDRGKELMNDGADVGNKELRDPIHTNDGLGNEGVNEKHKIKKDGDVNYDPGLWGSIDDYKRVMLVKRGPIKVLKECDEFLRDKDGRHFSSKHYIRLDSNGQSQERKWLVYSNELNKVFCFCCKLFKLKPMVTNLAEDGVNDWRNLSSKLVVHENNREHHANVVKWVDLQKALKQNATIDKAFEALNGKDQVG